MVSPHQAATLASTFQLQRVDPTPLPSPPLLHSLFLETPGAWVVVLLCIIIAAVLITRPKRVLRYTGIGALVMAIAVACLQHFIVTEHEEIILRSRAAVSAVARADSEVLSKLLAPNFKAVYYSAPQGKGRDETIEEARKFFGDSPASASIGDVQVHVVNNRFARGQILITASGSQTSGYSVTGWWTLSWENTINGWQITGAEMDPSTKLGF